jgi:predicted metal-dependent hydrolase
MGAIPIPLILQIPPSPQGEGQAPRGGFQPPSQVPATRVAGRWGEDSNPMIAIDQTIRTRRRTLAVIVEDDGRIVVRAPLRMQQAAIDEFVNAREKWILTKQEQALRRTSRFVPKRYVSGEEFLYLGDPYPLQIVDTQRQHLVFNGDFRLSRDAVPRAEAVFERWYRRQALRVLSERAGLYAAANDFAFNQIKITSARKQWGSCGPGGNLRFAWRLVMAPLPIVDYVVVHELVHLRHRNHSKRFWGKVKSILPDFRQREDWLEEHGILLHLS